MTLDDWLSPHDYYRRQRFVARRTWWRRVRRRASAALARMVARLRAALRAGDASPVYCPVASNACHAWRTTGPAHDDVECVLCGVTAHDFLHALGRPR